MLNEAAFSVNAGEVTALWGKITPFFILKGD